MIAHSAERTAGTSAPHSIDSPTTADYFDDTAAGHEVPTATDQLTSAAAEAVAPEVQRAWNDPTVIHVPGSVCLLSPRAVWSRVSRP